MIRLVPPSLLPSCRWISACPHSHHHLIPISPLLGTEVPPVSGGSMGTCRAFSVASGSLTRGRSGDLLRCFGPRPALRAECLTGSFLKTSPSQCRYQTILVRSGILLRTEGLGTDIQVGGEVGERQGALLARLAALDARLEVEMNEPDPRGLLRPSEGLRDVIAEKGCQSLAMSQNSRFAYLGHLADSALLIESFPFLQQCRNQGTCSQSALVRQASCMPWQLLRQSCSE